MQQNGVERALAGQTRAIQPEVGRALQLIAERKPGKRPVTLDRVAFAAHAVANIVKRRRQRLANAAQIITVPPAMRETANERRAQQALAVHNVVKTIGANVAQAANNFTQRRRRQQRVTPAPPGHRDNLVHRRMQAHQRGIGFLDQPCETGVRTLDARLGQGWHLMDHIAQR